MNQLISLGELQENDYYNIALATLPIMANFNCYYDVVNDDSLTADSSWSATSTLALMNASMKLGGLSSYYANQLLPTIPLSMIVDVAGIYYTNQANKAVNGGNSSTMCLVSQAAGLVLSAAKIREYWMVDKAEAGDNVVYTSEQEPYF